MTKSFNYQLQMHIQGTSLCPRDQLPWNQLLWGQLPHDQLTTRSTHTTSTFYEINSR